MSNSSPVEKIEQHRRTLENLSESDLPVSRVAEALLEIADSANADGLTDGEES